MILTYLSLSPVIVTMNTGHQDNGRATTEMWGKLDARGACVQAFDISEQRKLREGAVSVIVSHLYL